MLATTAKRAPPTRPSAMLRDDPFKQVAEQIAVTEAAMPVPRESRMIGDRTGEVEPAKPAAGQVERDLLAEAVLGADAHHVIGQQHADHQLRIDRWPSGRAATWRQMLPAIREIHELVNAPR